MADANKMKELLGKKKVVLKPAAAPAPKAAPLAEPKRDDEDGITLERPLIAPAPRIAVARAPTETTVEQDMTALAESTRPSRVDDGESAAMAPVQLPPPPKVAAVAPAPAPKGASGVDKIVQGVLERIAPEIEKLLQPVRQQLGELRAQLDELSGKVQTHEEDMHELNEEVESKMGVGALQAAEEKVQELAGQVEAVEKKAAELKGKVDSVETKVGTHDEDLKQLNEELEGKASGEEFAELRSAFQIVAGDDYERVHGLAQDYQETTTRLLVDYLLDLNEGNLEEFVEVLNTRGGDLSKDLMKTFLSVPETVKAELARRKGYKLSELEDPESVHTTERAMGAAGAKVEVEQEADAVLNNARSILDQLDTQTEGES